MSLFLIMKQKFKLSERNGKSPVSCSVRLFLEILNINIFVLNLPLRLKLPDIPVLLHEQLHFLEKKYGFEVFSYHCLGN